MKLPTLTILLAAALTSAAATRPNFVFMLSDDQSWNGLSVAMNPGVDESINPLTKTPNLEKLAAAGIRFSAAYAPASVCSPTRVSLQTGKSPARLGWTKASSSVTARDGYRLVPPPITRDLDTTETTVAELLKTAGYATAHFGKWHIGGGGPENHGYDASDGNTGNAEAFRHKDPNPVDIFGMAERAHNFMAKAKAAGKPFFIQLSFNALHAPENALRSTVASVRARAPGAPDRQVDRTAIAQDLDTGVGRVMDSLDQLGLAGDTYLIYMSDNGGNGGARAGRRTRSAALRGGKGSVWEGGIRVPLIVRGPGITPDSICHQRVVGYDWFPTFCQLAGVTGELPGNIEGGTITHLLEGGSALVQRPRPGLVFHFPHYQGRDGPHSALILENKKLLKFYETGTLKLFDLSTDLTEANDLAASQPALAARLDEHLTAHLEAIGAKLPAANPQFDPDNPPPPPAPRRRGRR